MDVIIGLKVCSYTRYVAKKEIEGREKAIWKLRSRQETITWLICYPQGKSECNSEIVLVIKHLITLET